MTVHRLLIQVSLAIHLLGSVSRIQPALLCIGLIFCGADLARSTEVAADAYAAELAAQAERLRLWDQRTWLLLLHYRRDVFGGYTSQADDPGFFLAADGKQNPRAELQATLRQFFSEQPVGRSAQPAQCAFVARYRWLKEVLQFDERRLVPVSCPRFDAWLKELSPAGITLIFPSAFMNNPASMFGHTLLRIDQRGQTEQTRLLAYTVNFAAEVGEDRGVTFALLGVAGGFKGYFSTLPYYLKVEEYGDFENRDIWEYRLTLTDAQISRLAEHVWEMGNAYFDYFYFKENCAYHILSLIEVANPAWHLTDRFLFWTLPSDTIRALTEQPGLIGQVTYRPSRSSIVKGRFATLSADERRWFRRMTDDMTLVTSPEWKTLPAARQAAVLDTVSDYLRYRSLRDPDNVNVYRERNREVLAARSDLKISSPPLRQPPSIAPPDQGHETARAGLAVGWRGHDHGQGEFFEELNVRAGYHDLLDPEQGYTPDAQIELLGVSLRHYERRNQTRLERFTLANILSLAPMNALFKVPSWKLNVGTRTIQHGDCRLCTTGFANGGIGAALESQLLRREVAFAFVEVEAEYGHAFEENHRGGGGGTVGMLAEVTDRWKLLASASYLRYAFGEQSDEVRLSFGQRYTVTQNFAIRMEFNRRARDNEALLTLHAYF